MKIPQKSFKKKILLMILIIHLISACNPSTIKLDWACFNGANKLDCNYSLFTGRETEEILLDTDEILEIEYEGDVESGTLILQIQDPEGQIIWKTKNTDQFIGARTIPIYKAGRYHLIAVGRDTQGYFHIEWKIET